MKEIIRLNISVYSKGIVSRLSCSFVKELRFPHKVRPKSVAKCPRNDFKLLFFFIQLPTQVRLLFIRIKTINW